MVENADGESGEKSNGAIWWIGVRMSRRKGFILFYFEMRDKMG